MKNITLKNKIIIGGMIIGLIGITTMSPAFTKYKISKNINIIKNQENNNLSNSKTIAMYKSDDGEKYTEIEGRMPNSGYIINEEKSYCNLNGSKDDNAILKTVDGNHVIANLIKGDKCYLYFDKYTPPITIPDIIAANNPKDETPTFSSAATTDEGVYKVSDGMYGGDSYYWRGAATNNYVKFANFCWRIIRINGDGSIRLIYDGTTCHANGTKTAESIAKTSQAYNTSYNRSEYVGYTYTEGSQRGDSSASNLKTQTESWFNTNITGTNATKVADGKYCNDRNVGQPYSSWSGYVTTWSATGTKFAYAGVDRLWNKYTPTLSCPSGDVYTLKVGLITADEVELAGGKNENNTSYYLYNGQNYWTMSPNRWIGTNAWVFVVYANGYLSNTGVDWTGAGLRPVISLKADTLFKEGTTGTQSNPYEVI